MISCFSSSLSIPQFYISLDYTCMAELCHFHLMVNHLYLGLNTFQLFITKNGLVMGGESRNPLVPFHGFNIIRRNPSENKILEDIVAHLESMCIILVKTACIISKGGE